MGQGYYFLCRTDMEECMNKAEKLEKIREEIRKIHAKYPIGERVLTIRLRLNELYTLEYSLAEGGRRRMGRERGDY